MNSWPILLVCHKSSLEVHQDRIRPVGSLSPPRFVSADSVFLSYPPNIHIWPTSRRTNSRLFLHKNAVHLPLPNANYNSLQPQYLFVTTVKIGQPLMRRYTDSAIFNSPFHPTTVSNADKVEEVIRVIKPSMSVVSSQ